MRSRIAIAGAALWIAASLAVGCSGGGEAPPAGARPPVTVRALMSHDPPSLSLLGKMDRNGELLASQLTDALVQFNEKMELVPRVAESFEFSEDGQTLTFRLREGVRWHDGEPVTADDVLFSVAQVRDPLVENRSFGAGFEQLVSIEAPDPRIGCGPFRFERFRAGEELVLTANDDYWDGRPHIDRLVFRIFADQRTGYQALLADELDLMVVTPDLWRRAQQEAADRLDSLIYFRLNIWQVYWNQDGSNPYFTDPRVRRALLLALDRQKFIDRVLHGLARPAVSTYHPDVPWTDRSLAALPYDPAEAARLLDEAGWVDADGDGVRERDGVPFRFGLMVIASTQPLNDQLSAWQQQSWAEVGVAATIEKLEWQQFRERRNAFEFAAAMSGIGFTPAPDQYDLYHSTARGEGWNFAGLADPEVDRLLEAGRSTWDPEERRRIYFDLQARLVELQPVAWIMHLPTPVLHDRRLQGLVATPFDHWRTTRGPRVWRWDAAGG
jgi:peptide/nickel transport system substrate-binding protein